jgi:hypothetical protein
MSHSDLLNLGKQTENPETQEVFDIAALTNSILNKQVFAEIVNENLDIKRPENYDPDVIMTEYPADFKESIVEKLDEYKSAVPR